jgi:hypothetical protein
MSGRDRNVRRLKDPSRKCARQTARNFVYDRLHGQPVHRVQSAAGLCSIPVDRFRDAILPSVSIGKHCQENNVTSTNVDRRTVLAGGAGLALSLIHGSRLAVAESSERNLAPGSPLRIESIEAFWLHDGSKVGASFPRLFVRVYTDQGIVGEAYTFFWHSWDQVMPLVNDGLAPILIGMDAMQIERCWQACWPGHRRQSLGGTLLSNVGGLHQ